MIFIDGLPFPGSESEGNKNLIALLEHPSLVAAVNLFKAMPQQKFPILDNSSFVKHVYVFQREYATVDPALVDAVGTDEATTCVGLVIRNQKNRMTSVAHLDSPGVVDLGLAQMLSLILDNDMEDKLEVHLIGGFEDASYEHANGTDGLKDHVYWGGYSFPLCSKVVDVLQHRQENFHLKTLCVLGHNTSRDFGGDARPIVNGFLFETSTGLIKPASFDGSSRCPDEIIRRIRVTVSSMDPRWNGKLLDTYDTHHDRFQIAPCSWALDWRYYALSLQQYSDQEILLKCSTSPSAEGPDFVENERRVFDYLIKYPDWSETFPMRKPRVFKRAPNGGWIRCC